MPNKLEMKLFSIRTYSCPLHARRACSLIRASRFLLLLIAVMQLLSVNNEAHAGEPPLKVGFVYSGSAGDYGWNNAHDAGRKYLEQSMKGAVITAYAERVPESSECERVMEKMVAQGNKLIFATSYGFLEPMLRVAKRHPDVRFMHCGRLVPKGVANVGSYFSSDYYEILYAAGVVAGKMTKANKLGYVGGYPIPALMWCMNAFTLGARSVNPKVTVHVIWTNSWEDPSLEAEATRGLIERGCDVMCSNLNTSMTVARTAEKAGVYSVATNYDLHSAVPKGWLTGQFWNWGPLYVEIAKSVNNKQWKPQDLRYTLKSGYSALAPMGASVPPPLQKQALLTTEQLKTGKASVFAAPLKDRDGKVRLAPNQSVDQEWLESMNWFVPGVQGSLPMKH